MNYLNNNYEIEYKALLKTVLVEGIEGPARDNNTRISIFGKSLEFNNTSGCFPMLTSKEMFFKNVKHELYWLLNGMTNINYLKKNGVSIWDLWADENGDIGDTYGRILRSFNGVDQFKIILNELKNNINSSRLVISLWNPVSIMMGNIRPCYHAIQFVPINKQLNIVVSQRSADAFIGLPYDMAVFCLLLKLISDKYDFIPYKVKINIGNLHIYKEHIQPVKEYLERRMHDLPILKNNQSEVINFDTTKINLLRYNYESFIKAKIIV
jgi:thymidylate synthase